MASRPTHLGLCFVLAAASSRPSRSAATRRAVDGAELRRRSVGARSVGQSTELSRQAPDWWEEFEPLDADGRSFERDSAAAEAAPVVFAHMVAAPAAAASEQTRVDMSAAKAAYTCPGGGARRLLVRRPRRPRRLDSASARAERDRPSQGQLRAREDVRFKGTIGDAAAELSRRAQVHVAVGFAPAR